MGTALTFLFLQGPHGPFFGLLAKQLKAAGHDVMRVAFNAGDEATWPADLPILRHLRPAEEWPETLSALIEKHAITDIVIYGDTRPVHCAARRISGETGLRLHAFEEGYLRPYWVTYERGGSNGHSRVMDISVNQMSRLIDGPVGAGPHVPPVWGTLWRHSWHGCWYHANILFRNRHYPNYRTHRKVSVRRESWLQVKRLAQMPGHLLASTIATARLLRSANPYHLALLQLSHDSAFVGHSDFASMQEFMETCVEAFARGARRNEYLVFKAHPFEDGRENLPDIAAALVQKHGLENRIKFIHGGRLARLLDHAKSVVTINSTAGQHALSRGLPLKILGRAVYAKPELVSSQELADFFARPLGPHQHSYRIFRDYLLQTSQFVGSYYSALGRARLARQIVPMMLAKLDPYEEFAERSAARFGQVRLVKPAMGQE